MSLRPLFLAYVGAIALLPGPAGACREPVPEPGDKQGTISVHVLGTSIGKPGSGMAVVLEESAGQEWRELARAKTDSAGRINRLWPATGALRPGVLPGTV